MRSRYVLALSLPLIFGLSVVASPPSNAAVVAAYSLDCRSSDANINTAVSASIGDTITIQTTYAYSDCSVALGSAVSGPTTIVGAATTTYTVVAAGTMVVKNTYGSARRTITITLVQPAAGPRPSHTFAVSAHDAKCPSPAWTLGGAELWNKWRPVCILTTVHDGRTWNNGTYDEVMPIINNWNAS